MANGDLAARIASGELRTMAKEMFAQAEKIPADGVCRQHAQQSRAIGCLLVGMDELITQRQSLRTVILESAPLWIPLSAISGGIACGLAFALARVAGYAP